VNTQLADLIADGRWRPGDKLLSESELCAQLDIGSSTVRAALKSFASAGLVQMRQDEGTYVMDGAGALIERLRRRSLLIRGRSLPRS
jgi:DNA-binding FadR family transcriptional regulator